METSLKHKLLVALGCVAPILSACGGGSDSPPPSASPPPPVPPVAAVPLECKDLAGMVIPASAIALPTTGGAVTEAIVVPAAGTGAAAVPEYCRVTGTISPVDSTAPKITFRVALPGNWNQKVTMFGGGGLDGTLPN